MKGRIKKKKENKFLAILNKTSNAVCLRYDAQGMIASSLLRNQSRIIESLLTSLGFLVTIILGGDFLNKTFSPKRTRCQISVLFQSSVNL
jgi:hypothetical protein